MKQELVQAKESLKAKYNKANEILCDAFDDAEKLCKNFLKERENNRFDFTDYYENYFDEVFVTYDGGNHPEYDSHAYATAYAVKLLNDVIYLEIDETNTYDIERCTKTEFIELVYTMLEYSEENLEE